MSTIKDTEVNLCTFIRASLVAPENDPCTLYEVVYTDCRLSERVPCPRSGSLLDALYGAPCPRFIHFSASFCLLACDGFTPIDLAVFGSPSYFVMCFLVAFERLRKRKARPRVRDEDSSKDERGHTRHGVACAWQDRA